MQFAVSEMHSAAEVQTLFHWDATFSGGMFTDNTALRKRITTMEIPKAVHEEMQVDTHGYKLPGPGIVRYNGEITITFFESVTADIIKQMRAAVHDIYSNPTGDVGGKQGKAYAALFGQIVMNLQDKQDATKQTYTLYKCIIKGDLDVGGDLGTGTDVDYFKPKMTIAYGWHDWVKG